MFYQFDVDKWIIHLLPPVLRKVSIFAFLRCLLYPIKQLHTAFLAYKNGVDRKLAYNAFNDYLERFLNTLFFFETKVIYITDVEYDWATITFQSEPFSPAYMSFQNETPATPLILSSVEPEARNGAFVVHVPSAFSQADIATVTNWVNFYKMAGTEFTVEVYE